MNPICRLDLLSQMELARKEHGFDFGTTCAMNRSKMKATRQLHDLRQSLWFDNVTRDLLNGGALKHYIEALKHYIDELTVTFPATAIQIDWQEE
jgi:hypothetical protein